MTAPGYRPRRAAGPYPVDVEPEDPPEQDADAVDEPAVEEQAVDGQAVDEQAVEDQAVAEPTARVPSWYGPRTSPPARPAASPATPVRVPSLAERFGPPTQAVGIDLPGPPHRWDAAAQLSAAGPSSTAESSTAESSTAEPPVPPRSTASPSTPPPRQLDLFARLAAAEQAPAPRGAAEPEPHQGGPRPPTGRSIAPIEFRGLTKSFGAVVAVDDLTFTVHPGRVTGFLGPNGAGKTTTLRMLVGLAAPTAGTATFGSRSYVELDRPQQVVGTALDATFHPGRTGRDHLRVLAATAGAGDDRVDELLERVDLTAAARRKAGTYSLGMRQRLSLASALLGDPDYLILDEPANGLDPEGIRWLRGFLRSFAAAGKVVLVSSHMLGEVQETVDDIAVIGHGRLLRCAPIGEIEIAEPAVRVRTAQPLRAAEALAGEGLIVRTETDGEGEFLRVQTLDAARIGAVLLDHRIAVIELTRERFTLEESFFRMIEHEAGAAPAAQGRPS